MVLRCFATPGTPFFTLLHEALKLHCTRPRLALPCAVVGHNSVHVKRRAVHRERVAAQRLIVHEANDHVRRRPPRDVDAAIESGGRHLVSEWAGRSDLAIERRCGVLRHIGAALRTRAEKLAQLESRDCGKPIAESRVDIETCAALFDYYAEIAPEMLADQPIALPDDAGAFRARVVPHAVGMVGAVTPWNYPLMQAVVGSLVGC